MIRDYNTAQCIFVAYYLSKNILFIIIILALSVMIGLV